MSNDYVSKIQIGSGEEVPIRDEGAVRPEDLLDLVYPVGSIYMSVSSVSPSMLFGGIWVPWGAGRVPVCVDTSQEEFNTVEEVGGVKEVTLEIDQMPSHTHVQNPHRHDRGGRWYSSSSSSSSGAAYKRVTDSRWELAYTETATAVNQPTGGDLPHTNLQPYITCYMWKRTN